MSDDFERGVSKIIFLSIISSSIHTFYFPSYHELLFSGKEKTLLKFNIGNYIITTFLYLILSLLFLDNFIYIYILYELIYFGFVFFSQYNFKNFFKLFKLSISSYYAAFLIIIYFTDIGNNLFVLVSIPFLVFDLKKLYEKLLKFNYFNN